MSVVSCVATDCPLFGEEGPPHAHGYDDQGKLVAVEMPKPMPPPPPPPTSVSVQTILGRGKS